MAPSPSLLLLFYVSIMQVVVGVVSVMFGSLSLTHECELGYIATGIWSGGWLILTGSIGIAASFESTSAWVISYLVLTAISILVAASQVTLETVAYIYTKIDCEVPTPPPCDDACLKYHEYMMGGGEISQALSIAGTVLAALYIRRHQDEPEISYKKMPL